MMFDICMAPFDQKRIQSPLRGKGRSRETGKKEETENNQLLREKESLKTVLERNQVGNVELRKIRLCHQ